MSQKDSPQDIIDSYRKRQQLLPFIIGGPGRYICCCWYYYCGSVINRTGWRQL